MAKKRAKKEEEKKEAKSKQDDKDTEEQQHQPRPFWSGVIAFGLVSLPVSLFPANRGRPVSLSMVDDEGNRLRRRYFCEKENRVLERDDIVRGYPVDTDEYLIVEDEELEAMAPDKSREIDLRRFVPLDELNPVFFERGYFLAPDSDATKAYRLLARSMEEEQRAGIATFVMRDREYIIAIMSERGILRAETLRFHDEIRSPEQVGLPEELDQPDKKLLQQIRQAIKARSSKALDPDLLTEQQVQRLRDLVDRKLASHTDVVEEEAPEEEAGAGGSNVVDLIQVLKERLQGQSDTDNKSGQPQRRPDGKSDGNGDGKRRAKKQSRSEPEELNRDELYEQAREKHIAGRSKMSKQELVQALKQAG